MLGSRRMENCQSHKSQWRRRIVVAIVFLAVISAMLAAYSSLTMVGRLKSVRALGGYYEEVQTHFGESWLDVSLWGIKGVSLSGTATSDADLERLPWLGGVYMLFLDETLITDKGLKALNFSPELNYLDVSRTSVTERGIRHVLENAKGLQAITAHGLHLDSKVVDTMQDEFPDVSIFYHLDG